MSRKGWAFTIIAAAILIAGGVLVGAVTYPGDPLRDANEYDTFADAVLDGAMQRGWMPAALPESARDIRERHHLDTNEVFGVFAFNDDDLGSLMDKGEFTPVPSVIAVTNEWVKDWRPARNLAKKLTATSGIMLRARRIDGFIIVVDGDTHTGYWWIERTAR